MIRIIRKYARLLDRRQKIRVLFLVVIMIIGAFLEMLGVSLMVPLLSVMVQPNIMETNKYIKIVCNLFDLHSYREFVLACIIVMILVFILKDLYIILQNYVQIRFIFNNQIATQRKVLRTFLYRPYEYYLYADSGEIIRGVGGDVSTAYSLLSDLLSFATETIVAVSLLITVFIINPWMTLFVGLIMGGISVAITKIIKPKMHRNGILHHEYSAVTNKWLIQIINGMKEIKISQKELFFESNYFRSGEIMNRTIQHYTLLQNMPRLLIEMSSVCGMLCVMGFMVYSGQEIQSLIPVFGAFAMAAVKLLPSANRIVTAINNIAFQEPALDKSLENLEILKCDVEDKRYIVSDNKNVSIKEKIELYDITYSYPKSNVKVLENAFMVVPAGKSVGIVGTSGAGKTTAVDILLGLLEPQEGKVLLDGQDIKDNYYVWLSHIGYIPQMIFMLDASIRENVAFGFDDDEDVDKKVWTALKEAQLADYVRGLPEGLDTKIGERGIRLSGGQRQRIGIARALYTNPDLLIFDEATSALDNETEAAIMESINALHGKKTMIIIAHRLTTIEGCDIVYNVENGKITEKILYE